MEDNHHNEKVPIHFPRVTYCEFSSTGQRKYRVKSYKPPVSNYFYSDNPNEDLCHGFQDDNDVSKCFFFFLYYYICEKPHQSLKKYYFS